MLDDRHILLLYKYLRRVVVGKLEEDELYELVHVLEKEVKRINKERIHEAIQRRNKKQND